MTSLKRVIMGPAIAALMASTLAATPAAAWSRYRNNDNAAAIAGAAIGGMALGAAVGAMASQQRYYNGYGYNYGYPPPPAYGYGPGYGYGYGY